MRKPKHLTAKTLVDFLTKLESKGADLEKIKINYRKDYDSDVKKVTQVAEDLFDEKTNNILESIVFVTIP